MKRTPSKSYHRSQEIGAGCSQSSHPRCGGSAVAPGSRKRAGCSVAPAPLCVRRQTDRQTTDRQTTDRQTNRSRDLSPCLLCAPLCRGGVGQSPVGGRSSSVGGFVWLGSLRSDLARRCRLRGLAPVPVVVRRLRETTPPAARPRCCALRSRLAKRLRAYRAPCAVADCVSGPAGLFVPPFARACLPFEEGVIL